MAVYSPSTTDDLAPGKRTPIEEVRLLFDGEERDLVDVAGFRNTYHGPEFPRVDLRLGIDHHGELYLLTKGDGWIRKLVPAPTGGQQSLRRSIQRRLESRLVANAKDTKISLDLQATHN